MTALAIDDGLILVLTWVFVGQTVVIVAAVAFAGRWLRRHWHRYRHEPKMIPRTDIIAPGWMKEWKGKETGGIEMRDSPPAGLVGLDHAAPPPGFKWLGEK